MSTDLLKEHYERKYSHESDSESIDTIEVKKIPVSRFEAAVKYFPRYFKQGDILELGAGNGNVAKALLGSELDIQSYTLGDLSLPRVEGIQKNLQDDRLKVLEFNAENIPQKINTQYDAIIMIALIEHLVDPLRAMLKLRELLKPSGFIYIDTPNIAKYTSRLKLLTGKFPSTGSMNEGLTTYYGEPVDLHEEGHLHYFTYRSLSLMLQERCGFSKVEKVSYPGGRHVFGKQAHGVLAKVWPEMFSELAVVAYA